MANKTFGDIKRELREELWPHPTESRALIKSHDKMFIEGMMDLQQASECLHQKNTTQFRFCATYFHCGKTVVDMPPYGKIGRVYTIANESWCDPVYYQQVSFEELECWSRRYLTFTEPTNEGLPELPFGFKYAEASADNDCATGRARVGMFAIHRNRLYVAPWLQSNETLVVEWDGVKGDWQDTDGVDDGLWNARVLKALRGYVEWQHCRRFGDDIQKGRELERAYYQDRANIILDCRDSIALKQSEVPCNLPPEVLAQAVEDDGAPDPDADIIIGAVGDFGQDTDARDEVAALIDGWDPLWFLSLGDQWYGSTSTEANLEDSLGETYQQFVADGRFLPCIGNHDRDPAGHLPITFDYFTFPKIKSELGESDSVGYYAKEIDQRLSIFVIDTGMDNDDDNQQADGITVSSKQAAWLRVALARSTSKFNIVVGHHNPYSSRIGSPSDNYEGRRQYADIRWPFGDWGADVYLGGHIHSYERLEVDGFPYIVCGTGGKDLTGKFTDDMSEYSQLAQDDEYGALKITCSCDALTIEHINVDGETLDTLTITK